MEKSQLVSSRIKKEDLKKPSLKKDPKRASFDEGDLEKKGSKSMAVEVERLKGFQELGQVRGRNSLSSSIPPTATINGGGGGRRRSFCSSQVELADFLSCNGVKIVAVDMPPFMQVHAVNCARRSHDSLEKFTSKTLAFTLKKVNYSTLFLIHDEGLDHCFQLFMSFYISPSSPSCVMMDVHSIFGKISSVKKLERERERG